MMKKLFYIDLALCSLWMLFVLGGRESWFTVPGIVAILGVLLRFVVSYSLCYREKRSWLPLAVFALLAYLMYFSGRVGTERIGDYFFALTKLEYGSAWVMVMDVLGKAWLVGFPIVSYFLLLFYGKLRRTELTWGELLGGVLWHNRSAKICSASVMLSLVAFLTGMAMDARLCLLTCLSAVPLTYWLLCRYLQIMAERVWALAVAMLLFWTAQYFTGVWRVLMLLGSLCLVVYVGTYLFRCRKNLALAVCATLYMAVLLPSFSVGHNPYACINYARGGYFCLSPFNGIIPVKKGDLYGLRDRYGLLVEPEYRRFKTLGSMDFPWRYVYVLESAEGSVYYDVLNNEFISE